jgi:hypothetical protein
MILAMLIVNELLVAVASDSKCLSNAEIENIPTEGLFYLVVLILMLRK